MFLQGERGSGALTAIRSRAPVVGGNFGSWGGVFSFFDCSIKGLRRKEDPFNPIMAGFCTGGALAMRGGFKHARNSAITCGCLLAVFEGVGMVISRMMTPAAPAPAVRPVSLALQKSIVKYEYRLTNKRNSLRRNSVVFLQVLYFGFSARFLSPIPLLLKCGL